MTATSTAIQEISIAHSPDSDDAFMFYGLATNKVRVPGFKFTPHPHRHRNAQSARHPRGLLRRHRHQLPRLSLHAGELHPDGLRRLGGRRLRPHGGLAAQALPRPTSRRRASLCPATLTTAFLTLKLFAPEVETTVVPFDKIIPAVVAGEFDAGLIIHEGQLTYGNNGLLKALDLGQWWREQTGLPLPLGGNAIRRALGEETMRITTNALRDSIQHALDHRDEALAYAMQFARDLDPALANQFVGMYVNERTLNYGEDGREAIRKLLDMGYDRGIIPTRAKVDFVD